MTPARMEEIIRYYGPRRVLFGTDYPMWPAEPLIQALLDMGFTDEEYRRMFSENALRVFCKK